MSDALTAPNTQSRWDLVSGIRPQLKAHIELHRHCYRGETCYILEDTITRTRYRFSAQAYEIVGRLTGHHRLDDIYSYLQNRPKGTSISKEETADIVFQLSRMEALKNDTLHQYLKPQGGMGSRGNSLMGQLKNSPLFLKVPLFSPSQILARHQGITRLVFTKIFAVLLVTLFTAAAVSLLFNWAELSHNAIDRIFTSHNLFLLWLLYPVLKTVHEFAHGFTVKHYGGDVTEMGMMLLLFVPVPYVNASDSASFPEKWQRIAVAGSGILAELALASLAILLWTAVEPGIVRSLCFNTILVCGVSTLIFNGNPLVRFDGYYILSDLVEIPNLATRSSSFLWYHFLRLVAGIKANPPSATSKTEKRWFITYGLAAFCYRLTIYGSIFYLFASKFGTIGAVIGIAGIAQLIFLPLYRRLKPMSKKGSFQHARSRIVASAVCLFGAISLAVLIPLPYSTAVEGVVWLPEESLVKMKTGGMVTQLHTSPGNKVEKGEVLLVCEAPELKHTILLLEAQIEELRLKEAAAFARAPFEAKLIQEKLSDLSKRLMDKKNRAQELAVLSPQSGKFIVEQPGQLVGKYFKQGETIGFIQNEATLIRTLIAQEDISPITNNLKKVEVSISSQHHQQYLGVLHSENPHSTFTLPSKTFSKEGGGQIITTSIDDQKDTMLQEMFQLDIRLSKPIDAPFPESRAYIRFVHTSQPLIFRGIRRIQQLFITQFRG